MIMLCNGNTLCAAFPTLLHRFNTWLLQFVTFFDKTAQCISIGS